MACSMRFPDKAQLALERPNRPPKKDTREPKKRRFHRIGSGLLRGHVIDVSYLTYVTHATGHRRSRTVVQEEQP